MNQLYCCLPSALSECIVPVINYCENNLIHFYSVPNVRNYLRHRMYFEMIGSVPILSIRKEPLGKIENKADKTHIRCNLLAALFMHIIPHYIPYCRSDHQNHFFGSHILPSET